MTTKKPLLTLNSFSKTDKPVVDAPVDNQSATKPDASAKEDSNTEVKSLLTRALFLYPLFSHFLEI